MTPCTECGMPCDPGEYHPFAACLMFKACHNSETVRANLDAVREAGRASGASVVVPEGFVLVRAEKLKHAKQQAQLAADLIVGFAKDNPGKMCGYLDDACTAAEIAARDCASMIAAAPAAVLVAEEALEDGQHEDIGEALSQGRIPWPFATPSPASDLPLTEAQILAGWGHGAILANTSGPPHRGLKRELETFTAGVRFTEQAHGIQLSEGERSHD